MTVEILLMWGAIVAYAVSAAGFVSGLFFSKPRLAATGQIAAAVGLVLQVASFALRWVRVGHGPYLGFYEVASALAFLAVFGFTVLASRWQGFQVAGLAVMPLALLILGGAMLVSKQGEPISGSLGSIWLAIHVGFANLAFGAYLASFALAVALLLSERPDHKRFATVLAKLPEPHVVDDLAFRFVGAGFLFQGLMIASGAIWANEAWGRYWAWDPMETWSLIAWSVYAVYLHLRLTMGWNGKKAAWLAVGSLFVITFSLLGVPLVYNSIHGAYLSL